MTSCHNGSDVASFQSVHSKIHVRSSYNLRLIRGTQNQVEAANHVAFVPQQFRLIKLLPVLQEEYDISDGSDPALSLAMEEAATWAACD